MTISSGTSKVAYLGDGETTTFAVPFYFLANDEVKVLLTAGGVETVWTEGTHYTLTGAGQPDGGALIVATSPSDYTPADGTTLTIKRNLQYVQETDYPEGGQFPAIAHERALDRVVMLAQQLAEGLSRAVKLRETSTGTDPSLPDAEAGRALVWNDDENGLVNRSLIGSQSIAGKAINMIRVADDDSDFEFRTPVQVRSDIGADDAANLAIGTVPAARLADVLQSLIGLGGSADKMIYYTGATTLALAATQAFGRSLLELTDAAALRTAAGLGTLAEQDANAIAITGGAASFTGDVVLAADPDSAMKAATKQYVDGMAAGLGKRGRVRAAATSDLTLSGTQTVDGVALIAGDLILVKNQASQADNGIYTVASGAWSRDTNYDSWSEIEGCLIAVEEGSTQADTLWLCTSNSGGTLGTTAATFAQIFPGSGGTVTQVSAGEGVTTSDGNPITSTGTVKLDIAGLTANAAPALSDPLAYYLTASSAHRKITFQQLFNLGNGLSEDTAPDTANDFLITYDASAGAAKKVKLQNAAPMPGLPAGYITGLTLSNNGADATNDIDITAGRCRDATNTVDIVLSSTYTKQLDVSWAVGTNAGGRDTGSIADGMWAVWAIKRSDTGVCDVLFSTSFTAPTMPTNYDYKRLIGAIYRASAAITRFIQTGDEFLWETAPIAEVNVLTAPPTLNDAPAVWTSLTLVSCPPSCTFLCESFGKDYNVGGSPRMYTNLMRPKSTTYISAAPQANDLSDPNVLWMEATSTPYNYLSRRSKVKVDSSSQVEYYKPPATGSSTGRSYAVWSLGFILTQRSNP